MKLGQIKCFFGWHEWVAVREHFTKRPVWYCYWCRKTKDREEEEDG